MFELKKNAKIRNFFFIFLGILIVLGILAISFSSSFVNGGVTGNAVNLYRGDFNNEIKNSNVPVLIKFGAEWCGPCRKMDAETLPQLAQKSDIKIVKVDIDNSFGAKLFKDFGGPGRGGVPQTYLYCRGKVIFISLGFIDRDSLNNAINKIIQNNVECQSQQTPPPTVPEEIKFIPLQKECDEKNFVKLELYTTENVEKIFSLSPVNKGTNFIEEVQDVNGNKILGKNLGQVRIGAKSSVHLSLKLEKQCVVGQQIYYDLVISGGKVRHFVINIVKTPNPKPSTPSAVDDGSISSPPVTERIVPAPPVPVSVSPGETVSEKQKIKSECKVKSVVISITNNHKDENGKGYAEEYEFENSETFDIYPKAFKLSSGSSETISLDFKDKTCNNKTGRKFSVFLNRKPADKSVKVKAYRTEIEIEVFVKAELKPAVAGEKPETIRNPGYAGECCKKDEDCNNPSNLDERDYFCDKGNLTLILRRAKSNDELFVFIHNFPYGFANRFPIPLRNYKEYDINGKLVSNTDKIMGFALSDERNQTRNEKGELVWRPTEKFANNKEFTLFKNEEKIVYFDVASAKNTFTEKISLFYKKSDYKNYPWRRDITVKLVSLADVNQKVKETGVCRPITGEEYSSGKSVKDNTYETPFITSEAQSQYNVGEIVSDKDQEAFGYKTTEQSRITEAEKNLVINVV